VQHSPGFLALVEDARSRIQETDIHEVKQWIEAGEEIHLVDVREGEEWARGHLPGAVHLCKGIIERDVESTFPNKGVKLLLYCGGGYRSALAADSLQKMGYANVLSMKGGWRGWTEAGYPVVKD